MIDIHCTLFLTIVFPEFFVMVTFDFGERYLGKERFFDSLISIFRHYILHKPVVNVCSE